MVIIMIFKKLGLTNKMKFEIINLKSADPKLIGTQVTYSIIILPNTDCCFNWDKTTYYYFSFS